MRLKKGIACLIISILILAVANNVFAVTAKKETVTKAAESENKISDSVTNETKKEDTTTNKTKETTNKTETKTEAKTETKTEAKPEVKTETKKETEKTTTKKTSKSKVISEDVTHLGTDDDLEYNNMIVEGNMFVANSDTVTFNNVKVEGDVIVFSNKVEIQDSEIAGNLYTAANEITISGSQLISAYVGGNTIEVIEGTEIVRELRTAGNSVTIDAEIGRDVYVFANQVEFGEDAVVFGKAILRTTSKSIAEDCDINELDYEKVEYEGYSFSWDTEDESSENELITYLIRKGTEIAIILIIALFLLYGFPKFTEVNSSLRIRDFFKAFFTGLLEFIVVILIAVGLFFTIYGIGYGLLLINLLIVFTILGKVIFMISFAIRMSCNPSKISCIKAFFATVLVAVIVAAIEMISLLGPVGFIINVILNIILAFTGLGSMFRVIFTSKKKLAQLSARKMYGKQGYAVENAPQSVPVAPAPVVEEKLVEKVEVNHVQEELQTEVKAEIKEEINELKEEREEEKKLEETSSIETTVEEPKEEVQLEQPKEEAKTELKEERSEKKEENKNNPKYKDNKKNQK